VAVRKRRAFLGLWLSPVAPASSGLASTLVCGKLALRVYPARQPSEGYEGWRRLNTESTPRRRPPCYDGQVDARPSVIG
jgi:hypothetical protein